ncbi:glycoside hydrolase family 13 protein [Mycolicibacterium neoaurum]|uniref:glycoside hydrolase family 13 protein n=1 Tax=Mycolicibacterium neoaurum TaxID=1795 RepID=UPI00248B616A|nr:glycoside hydrolase family 13 protein [Mycolicibacterium neoaurum]WBP93124.1 glycoside hydrolase family 13 protein [Mycolicibacterium neoaurum]WBS06909.1 glycoside hydrolase family 13 protein [Mycolicibacterium neoaurum]
MHHPTWWSRAVFYQIYPRSFADSNGDGVGDLDGITARMDYLAALGVQALWLNPVMVSPMADHGYDVSDPRDIDPLFGDLAALDGLVAAAHDRSIRVTMDLVPNHVSSAHPWFVEALADPSRRDRFIFRDGTGADGASPPNNWVSIFGGPAWTRVPDGQWYLHLFDSAQPDLNWEHPEVFADIEVTLRFWLDRGVDGFRIDVAHGMAKPADLPDMDLTENRLLRNKADDPRFDDDAVHDIHRFIRRVLDDYPDAVTVGEIWVHGNEQFAKYLRPDELHLGFNFQLVQADFAADAVRTAIDNSLAAAALADAPPTWTLSNHDVVREVSRYGDGAVGLARARAMALVTLALPGSVFVYNGAELGLPNVDLPDEVLQDPVWERSGRSERGRDGCRVPIPWSGSHPPYGFAATADTWLPMPAGWESLTVQAQSGDPSSTLELYRRAIELRSTRTEFSGDGVEWIGPQTFRRTGGLMCVVNTGDRPLPLPAGEVLLASGPLADGALPPDTAAWVV